MQTQKDEIRNKILKAATDEFLTNEYRKASLRGIAGKANITVSNIYCYFKNKAELYIAVVEPAWEGIQQLIDIDKKEHQHSANTLVRLSVEITNIFLANRSAFEILLKGDSDTPLKTTRGTLVELVQKHISEDIVMKNQCPLDAVVIKAFSAAICEAMICVLSAFDGNKELLTKRIYTVILSLIGNAESYFTSEDVLC